jgi:ribosomal protein S18 acetylase RimI-like enzyme
MSAGLSSTRQTVTVRPMNIHDLEFVSAAHGRYLPGGFFADLGGRFLRRYYYTVLTSPASVTLIAEDRGRPVGFLVGTVEHTSHARHLVRHSVPGLVLVGCWALLRRPGMLVRLVRTRLRRYGEAVRRNGRPPGNSAAGARRGVLVALAVEEAARRGGAGRALVTTFVEIAQLYGTATLALFARDGSPAATSFYPSLGWSAGARQADRDGNVWIPFGRQL